MADALTGVPTADRLTPVPTGPHAILYELIQCGLSWREARALPYEDALCLLHIHHQRQQLAALDAEAARLASLPLADPHSVQRELRKVQLRAKGIAGSMQ
jgi:hypothetical protein